MPLKQSINQSKSLLNFSNANSLEKEEEVRFLEFDARRRRRRRKQFGNPGYRPILSKLISQTVACVFDSN